jgi:hypothetical protein
VEAYAHLNVKFLDWIAVKLEDYKQKYGQYPDSLIQLKCEYPYVIITDPILSRNRTLHKFVGFYYTRHDDAYTLFSSGVDCIPNTSDDIYPDVGKSR